MVGPGNLTTPDTGEVPVDPGSPPLVFPPPRGACVSGDPRHKERAHHPRDDSSPGRNKAAVTPEAQEMTMKAQSHTFYRDDEAGKRTEIEPEAAQLRQTKNLCDSATYWKIKERTLTPNLSSLKCTSTGTVHQTT